MSESTGSFSIDCLTPAVMRLTCWKARPDGNTHRPARPSCFDPRHRPILLRSYVQLLSRYRPGTKRLDRMRFPIILSAHLHHKHLNLFGKIFRTYHYFWVVPGWQKRKRDSIELFVARSRRRCCQEKKNRNRLNDGHEHWPERTKDGVHHVQWPDSTRGNEIFTCSE